MVGVALLGADRSCSRNSRHQRAASSSLHPALGGGGCNRRWSSAAVGRADGCLARQRRISCSSSSGIAFVVCFDGGVGATVTCCTHTSIAVLPQNTRLAVSRK